MIIIVAMHLVRGSPLTYFQEMFVKASSEHVSGYWSVGEVGHQSIRSDDYTLGDSAK